MSHGSEVVACDALAVPSRLPATSAAVALTDRSNFLRYRIRDRTINVNLFRSCGRGAHASRTRARLGNSKYKQLSRAAENTRPARQRARSLPDGNSNINANNYADRIRSCTPPGVVTLE